LSSDVCSSDLVNYLELKLEGSLLKYLLTLPLFLQFCLYIGTIFLGYSKREPFFKQKSVTKPKVIFNLCLPLFRDQSQESGWVYCWGGFLVRHFALNNCQDF